jgi:hypothetical protein
MPLSHEPPEESTMSRAKANALAMVDQGDLQGAIDTMVADLGKDPRYAPNMGFTAQMAMALKADPNLTKEKVVDWVNGFNE